MGYTVTMHDVHPLLSIPRHQQAWYWPNEPEYSVSSIGRFNTSVIIQYIYICTTNLLTLLVLKPEYFEIISSEPWPLLSYKKYYMMTSSNGDIFRVTGPLCGEFTGHPSQTPVTRSFDVFFDLRLNKRLSKHSRRRWYEMPWRTLWHHCIDKRNNTCAISVLRSGYKCKTFFYYAIKCARHRLT